jgi:truncated hemoglobin YjbI
MNSNLVTKIIIQFYVKATHDILIGYHFRVIKDFEEHIPRIALFWEVQLGLKSIEEIKHVLSQPFQLIPKHKALNINKGEIFRWTKLFEETLDEFVKSGELESEDKEILLKKVEFFKDKLLTSLF